MRRARELETPVEVSAGKAAWVAALIGLVATWAGVTAPAWATAQRGGETTIAPAEAPPGDTPLLLAKSEAGVKGTAMPLAGLAALHASQIAPREPVARLPQRPGWLPQAPLASRVLLDVAPKTSPPRARELA